MPRKLSLLLCLAALPLCAQFDSHNAKKIWGIEICATPTPSDTNVLTYSASSGCWQPGSGGGSVTYPSTTDFFSGNGSGALQDSGVAPSAIPYLNPAGGSNTYTAGIKNIFQASATTAGVRIAGASNPSSPAAGDLNVDGSGCLNWYTGAAWVTLCASTGTGNTVAFATSPTLVTPVLGAATATSVIATGIVDGLAATTVTTGATQTAGGTYSSENWINENATAATAITYTLPTAAKGRVECFGNGYNGSAANTGTLELLTSATGQFIIYTDGTLSATGGYVISGGAAGDFACLVGLDSTHWYFRPSQGTWTKH